MTRRRWTIRRRAPDRGVGAAAPAAAPPGASRDLALVLRLVADLAAAPSGTLFVYDALDRVMAERGADDALLVVDDVALGRQLFRAGRRPPASFPLAATLPPGLHLAGAVISARVAAAVSELCIVAMRLDVLGHDASHDPLTGLLNRRSFEEVLAQSFSRCERYGWGFALVLVDIDDFKGLNDRLGHEGGDRVLRAVGVELRTSLRAGDVAARIGGDEFALLLAEGDADLLASLQVRLSVAVSRTVSGTRVGFSAGYALAPDDAEGAVQLYKVADRRLYESKARRHGPSGTSMGAGA